MKSVSPYAPLFLLHLWAGIMGFDLYLELIPLWGSFRSLGHNNLDTAAKTAIKAAWGDRGGNLVF
jgi:hypothetical protein